MQSVWYSIKVIAVQKRPEALGLIAICLVGGFQKQRSDGGQAFRGNGKLTPEQEEIRKLRSQVKNLRMEKEILKKATVFFAKEMK